MSDSVDKTKRSEVMRAVKSKGNKSTELKLIKLFKENGIKGWRRGYPVKGHPDFVFLDKKVAVFVDGCLWHGHSCRHWPKSNVDFWKNKIEGNMRHDLEINELFENRGWTVLRIWECELLKKNLPNTLERINRSLGFANWTRTEVYQNDKS